MHAAIALLTVASLSFAAPAKPWFVPSSLVRTATRDADKSRTVVQDSIKTLVACAGRAVRLASLETARVRFPLFILLVSSADPSFAAGKCLPCFSSSFRTCNSARSTAALSWYASFLPFLCRLDVLTDSLHRLFTIIPPTRPLPPFYTLSIPGYSLKSGRCGKICPVPHSVVSTDCYAEQCEAGWIADGGNCYKHCQAGYHAASVADDALCVRCSDANAATCGAGGGTLTCKEQYYPDDTTKKWCVGFTASSCLPD